MDAEITDRGKMVEYMVVIGGIFAFLAGLVTAIYFWKRERKVEYRIQRMLDDAIAGKHLEVLLDESKTAVIENSMWRFLCDKEVFEQNIKKEKLEMQTIISDISHQAVIPISNIILYSQLVEEQLKTEEIKEQNIVEESLTAIREQAKELDFLIEALVKLSRTETGMIHVNPSKQSLQPVLDRIKLQFQEKAKKKTIEFIVEETEESAVFDLKWTIEAVANIVDNAVKYTPEQGSVMIRIESYASFVRMDVVDNGIGISETEQAAVFGRFYRSHAVSNEPGVGIGLYLAREVMKAQNGYIKVVSEVGKGSKFSLYFLKEKNSQK